MDNKKLPKGVYKASSGRFKSTAIVGGRQKHLGYYSSVEEARYAWVCYKLENISNLHHLENVDELYVQLLKEKSELTPLINMIPMGPPEATNRSIRNPLKRSNIVMGVGINDSEYKATRNNCPVYRVWSSMIRRCYDEEGRNKYPSYAGCTVCEEWLTFSKFKAWVDLQDFRGKHLDKDLLVVGNKIYSPETCVFVHGKVNLFVTEKTSARGDWPIGVSQEISGKFVAMVGTGLKTPRQKYLGRFLTPEEAHQAWLAAKLELAKELAAEILSEGGDIRVAKALVSRYENYSENNQS